MALFQTSVLKKYLAGQDKDLLLDQYNIFKSYFLNPTIQNNIIAQKEEQFQEGFLRELFVKVLGYTISPEPDFNLTTELKNIKDAKKADGAIINKEKVLAVIELKGTDTTNLTKIEQQAFNYKNNQDGCRYVITSNFQKVRFYIDNAIENIEWDLFKLDYDGFSLLYLCLAQANIFYDLPAKIKTESVTVEEQVTKQLYKEYSQFRKSLFTNIVELNTNYNKLELFKKTQKLLDRFLFLFFAEDRLLVPPNSVRMILDQWTELKERYDEYQPLYERFKKYFGYLNTGFLGKQHEIFAYNGGLFASDEILDSIKIDDATLYNATLGLSNYDYNSEVDVNILGHIFEHSLTEIEELEKEITSSDAIDTKATKRKKDGVFYTPKYITKYIVENTVGSLCKNKKEELKLQEEDYHKLTKKAKKQLYDNLMQYREWLLHITIIDPACGSGAFLNQALEFLIAEHRWIAELEANIFNAPMVFDVESSILENNLFGVDINEESVEIAKLSLWLRTARKGRKLNSLNNNIKCGNSLIDDPNVAGDKAFNWQEQFPHIFDKGGFDVVIGNPPYTYRNAIQEGEKVYFDYRYKSTEGNYELYKIFLEKALELINNKGIVSLITSSSFLILANFKKLRELILDTSKIENIVPLGAGVFDDATVDTSIITLSKSIFGNDIAVIAPAKPELLYQSKKYFIEQARFKRNKDFVFNCSVKEEYYVLIEGLKRKFKPLKEYFDTGLGINTGYIKDDLVSSIKHSNKYHKMLGGSDIGRYEAPFSETFIMYDKEFVKSKGKLGRSLPPEKYFNNDKILIVRTRNLSLKRRIIATVDFEKHYNLNRLSNIISIDNNSIVGLLAVLNSNLINWIFSTEFLDYEIKPVYLKEVPLCNVNDKNLITHSEKMLSKNKELHNVCKQLTKLINIRYPSIKINGRLEKWHILSFSEFCKELTKQKIKLSLSEQSEWLTFFEQEKQKALAIKNEIDNTDKEIDQMVYQLYGLTEEEIRIVEGK